MRVVDTGIDDRDLDVLALKGRRTLPDLRRADERDADHILYVVLRRRDYLNHSGEIRETGDLAARYLNLNTVQCVVIVREHRAAPGHERRLDRGLLLGDLLVNCVVILFTDHVSGGTRAELRDRRRAHRHHHIDPLIHEQRQGLFLRDERSVIQRFEAARRRTLLRECSRGTSREGGNQNRCRNNAQTMPQAQRRSMGNNAFVTLHADPYVLL